ncbi:LemA family protein [Marinifilum sp. RC60d5]|uniref:LemA family protein n=1 Tax=Marinifilum sp. RC60d5 TaxID=3458414 RepID=UPI0040370215
MSFTIIIISVVVFGLILMYNNLVRRRNDVDNAFGAVDAELKKRFDLIPNLTHLVKKYASHEKELLVNLTELRTAVLSNKRQDLDQEFTSTMKSVMVMLESYPTLKASENFIKLQGALGEVEMQISAARRTYNSMVTRYNSAIQVFPQNIIAIILGFKPQSIITITKEERENVKVSELI